MKKKFLALLLCAGMFAEAAIPLSANDSGNIIVESDYGGTENGISVETDSEEMSTLDFLIPVEQKTEVPEGYIGIYTAEDLDNIRNDVFANYILMNNIDLSEYENWEPIHEYYGIFDGNGYTISNLVIDITNESVDYHSIGLFGGVYDAFIRNLSMQDCNIVIENAISDVGLISGSLSRSEIENCVASGRIEYINEEKTDTVSSIGGVSGYVIRSSMQNILCDVNMNVNFKNAPTCVGGMFGLVYDLNGDFIISNLLSRGNIIVFEDGIGHCGGVIGELRFYKTTSKVASITNTGDIQYTGNAYHTQRVGGIFGSMISYNSANVNVSNLLNTATIRSYGADCGGIIGSFHNPTGSGESFETSVSVIDFSHIYNSGTLNCSVERDSSNSNYRAIGGLFGEIVYPGTESSVDGCSYVDITISDSYNSGDIHATVEGGNFETYFFTTYYISGIVGMGTTYNRENDENSYNHLQLENIYNVGNLFVSQDENEDSTYRTNIHDIIGLPRYFLSDEIGITSCYYPSNSVANCVVSGCTPLSDSEMQSASSFVGFDFDTVWEIGVTEGYPYPTLRNNPHSGSNKPMPSENVLVGKTFTQSTLRALGYDTIPADYAVSKYPPFLQFTNENSGIFYIVNSEFGYPVNFTYTLAGDLITITPSDAGDYAEGRFGQATELVMQMTEDGNLKVKSYSPEPTDTNNYAIGWTTYDDIFLLKDIPSVKPTVSNMPSDYQINLGESFDLSNVAVTAGNGGKLNKVTLKHNLTGTTFVPSSILVAYQSSSITLGDNFILSGDNYPLNTVGTHEFIIYASADNFIAADNQIATFTVTVTEPEVPFLVGNKYVQTTNTDKFDTFLFDAPYFMFNDTTSGKFYWNNPETGESGTDTFTYTISENTVTLTAGRIYLGNVADEIVLNIIDEKRLEIAEIINYSSTEELSIGCTGVGDQFEVEIEQAKPSVTGLEKNYTVTQGDKLNLNFTVTAGNGANLKVVTLKNNAIKEPLYKETNISANSHTVKYTLSTDTLAVGTHTFVVYASADNYTVTDNSVATFTVTIKGKTDVDEPQSLIDRIIYMIVCNEHNTDYKYDGSDYYYGSVTINDNGASAIGIFQWREGRTFDLLNAIVNCDLITQEEVKEILGTGKLYDDIVNGDRSAWEKRKLTTEEAEKVKTLLLTSAGINEQDYMAQKNAEEYRADAEECGITQEAAKIVYADARNIGKGYADEIAKSAIAKVSGNGSKVTWELLLNEYASHEKLGANGYKQRRDRLERLLTEWYGTTTPDKPVDPDVPSTDNIVIAGVDIGYKDGQYFTKDGKACDSDGSTCHKTGVCDEDKDGCNCKHEFIVNGKKVKLNATQCYGYARYCSYIVYGKFPAPVYTGVTVDDVKEKLLSVKPGSHLWNSSQTHAIVLVGADGNNITYTDANYTGSPCQIRLKTETWEKFKEANYIKNGSYTIFGEKTDTVSINKVTETYSGNIITEGVTRDGYLTDGTTFLMLEVEVKGAKRIYMQIQTLSGGSLSGIVPYDEPINVQDVNVTTTHKWEQVIPNGTPSGTYAVIISASNSSISNDPKAIKDSVTFYIKVAGNVEVPTTSTPEEEVYLTELNKLLISGEISETEYYNRKTVLEEASRYCNFEWTAPVTFHTWKSGEGVYNSNKSMVIAGNPNSVCEFVKGVTYRGLPYCAHAPNNRQSIEDWEKLLKHAPSAESLEGTACYLGINRNLCTIYGIDCAGLVMRSYQSLSGYKQNYGYLNTTDLKSNNSPFTVTTNLKPGDILLKVGHVMIYAGKTISGNIMVYESVADGQNNISGCVYRSHMQENITDYKYYSYKNIAG